MVMTLYERSQFSRYSRISQEYPGVGGFSSVPPHSMSGEAEKKKRKRRRKKLQQDKQEGQTVDLGEVI